MKGGHDSLSKVKDNSLLVSFWQGVAPTCKIDAHPQ